MLKITVPMPEYFDDSTNEFVWDEVELELEHSLLSVSKWESEFQKLFLVPGEKTAEEIFGYIRCMILTPDYPPEVLDQIAKDPELLKTITDYWNANLSGTVVPENKNQPPSRERISSELMYYWMTKYRIPWEAQEWHLSRLFALIRIFGVKEAPAKKVPPAQAAAERKAENARRRAAAGSRG